MTEAQMWELRAYLALILSWVSGAAVIRLAFGVLSIAAFIASWSEARDARRR